MPGLLLRARSRKVASTRNKTLIRWIPNLTHKTWETTREEEEGRRREKRGERGRERQRAFQYRKRHKDYKVCRNNKTIETEINQT